MYGRFGIGSVCNVVGVEKGKIVRLLTKGRHIKSEKIAKFSSTIDFQSSSTFKNFIDFQTYTRARDEKTRETPGFFEARGLFF